MKKALLLLLILFITIPTQAQDVCEQQLAILAAQLIEYPQTLLYESSTTTDYKSGTSVDTLSCTIGAATISKLVSNKDQKLLDYLVQVNTPNGNWNWHQQSSKTATARTGINCLDVLEILSATDSYLHYMEFQPDLIHPAYTIGSLPDSTLKKVVSVCVKKPESTLYGLGGVVIVRDTNGVTQVIVRPYPALGSTLLFIYKLESGNWTWFSKTEDWGWSSPTEKDMAAAQVWRYLQEFLADSGVYLEK